MANVFDVANYILESIGGKISTYQLQKLCYYSQAWTLAWRKTPLFEEDFEKWDNGPVCKELFDLHKGRLYVSASIIPKNKLTNKFDCCERMYIDNVVESYGKYSGAQLSTLSHSEEPYKKAKRNGVINKEHMEAFYSSLSDCPIRYNEETELAIAEGKQLTDDIISGKVTAFNSIEDMLKDLNA